MSLSQEIKELRNNVLSMLKITQRPIDQQSPAELQAVVDALNKSIYAIGVIARVPESQQLGITTNALINTSLAYVANKRTGASTTVEKAEGERLIKQFHTDVKAFVEAMQRPAPAPAPAPAPEPVPEPIPEPSYPPPDAYNPPSQQFNDPQSYPQQVDYSQQAEYSQQVDYSQQSEYSQQVDYSQQEQQVEPYQDQFTPSSDYVDYAPSPVSPALSPRANSNSPRYISKSNPVSPRGPAAQSENSDLTTNHLLSSPTNMSPAFDGIDLNVDNAFDAISPAPPNPAESPFDMTMLADQLSVPITNDQVVLPDLPQSLPSEMDDNPFGDFDDNPAPPSAPPSYTSTQPPPQPQQPQPVQQQQPQGRPVAMSNAPLPRPTQPQLQHRYTISAGVGGRGAPMPPVPQGTTRSGHSLSIAAPPQSRPGQLPPPQLRRPSQFKSEPAPPAPQVQYLPQPEPEIGFGGVPNDFGGVSNDGDFGGASNASGFGGVSDDFGGVSNGFGGVANDFGGNPTELEVAPQETIGQSFAGRPVVGLPANFGDLTMNTQLAAIEEQAMILQREKERILREKQLQMQQPPQQYGQPPQPQPVQQYPPQPLQPRASMSRGGPPPQQQPMMNHRVSVSAQQPVNPQQQPMMNPRASMSGQAPQQPMMHPRASVSGQPPMNPQPVNPQPTMHPRPSVGAQQIPRASVGAQGRGLPPPAQQQQPVQPQSPPSLRASSPAAPGARPVSVSVTGRGQPPLQYGASMPPLPLIAQGGPLPSRSRRPTLQVAIPATTTWSAVNRQSSNLPVARQAFLSPQRTTPSGSARNSYQPDGPSGQPMQSPGRAVPVAQPAVVVPPTPTPTPTQAQPFVVPPFDADGFELARQCIEQNNIPGLRSVLMRVNTNMQDVEDEGNTLLHWAVGYNNVACARELLLKGARQMTNDTGMTPLELASQALGAGDQAYFAIKQLFESMPR